MGFEDNSLDRELLKLHVDKSVDKVTKDPTTKVEGVKIPKRAEPRENPRIDRREK
jgi:hypothetical protein